MLITPKLAGREGPTELAAAGKHETRDQRHTCKGTDAIHRGRRKLWLVAWWSN